ncbi:MAG: maltose ABC transporter permease [Candidatus Chloroheliales bacterium]|nr:MAG: maltose ABC transporter permease [Chloroflexota bacterium]
MSSTDVREAAEARAAAHAAKRYRSVTASRRINLGIKLLVALLAAVFSLYPLLWIVSAALSPSNSLVNQTLVPPGATLDNFVRLWTDPQHPFLLWLWNSILVSAITAIIVVSLCALGAYAFSRFRWRGRRTGLLAILLVQLFPNILAITSLFLLLQQIGKIPGLGWLGLNTHGGLILIYSAGALGFNTWLMKGFFDSIPRELDESAKIDGASQFQAFRYVILPLARPILATMAILSIIGTYADFLVARVMLRSSDEYTLAVGLTLFIRGQYEREWGVFAAAALVGALPVVLIFLVLQRQLIGGLARGAVKG